MEKVLAVRELKKGVLYSYGEGVLVEDQVPNVTPFKDIGMVNPCIKLDNGGIVWGFECWWGTLSSMKRKFEQVKKTIIVKPLIVIEPLKIRYV